MKHQSTNVRGEAVIMEDLREHCLYRNLKADNQQIKWWDYMKYAHKMCYVSITEECSKLGHKSIGVDYETTMKCVKESFVGNDMKKDDNRILKEMAADWKKYGTGYWPSIVINDRTYRGDVVPVNVLNALCAGF